MIAATAIAAVLALLALWLVWSRWALDVVSLFCASVALFYGVRMLVLAAGLDVLFPERILGDAPEAMATANLLLAVYLLAVLVAVAPGTALGDRLAPVFPRSSRVTAVGRLRTVAIGLSVATAAIVGVLVLSSGGFAATVRAAKLEDGLAGTFVLRVIPAIAATVAVIGVLEWRRQGRPHGRGTGALLVVLATANGAAVLVWGARSVLAVAAFALVTGVVVFRPPTRSPADGETRRRPLATRLVIGGLVVVVLVVGLRLGRDVLLSGEVNQTVAATGTVRQLSLTTNATQYDAFVLTVRDWPTEFEHRDGAGFAIGAVNWIPRRLWPEKPTITVPGRWLRDVYEPGAPTGWPMGTTGEWYLDLGVPGVLIGGLLTGLALGIARRTYHDTRDNAFGFVCSIVVAFLVLDGGWSSQTVTQWVAWCLPLILVGRWVRTAPADVESRPADAVTSA